MKKLVVAFALLSLVAVLFGACGNSTSASSSPTVHMSDIKFVQDSITIPKGSSLTLVDDAAVTHIIENGTWESNGTQKPGKEPGAPTVEAQFQGNDRQTIGPFNTTGTYHLYCSIHVNMNLTVIVQ